VKIDMSIGPKTNRCQESKSVFQEEELHLSDDSRDRRGSNRFPIEREVRYRVISKKSNQEAGGGTTVNMSSSGILFTAEHVLLPGRSLEVSVSWPAQLNNTCPLKLVARGRVVRFDGGKAAIEIQHYEFRTQGSQGLAPAMR
jgi:hypothetical protein